MGICKRRLLMGAAFEFNTCMRSPSADLKFVHHTLCIPCAGKRSLSLWDEHSCHALFASPAGRGSFMDVRMTSTSMFYNDVRRLGAHALPAVLSWMRSDWENLITYAESQLGRKAVCALLALLGCV